MTTRDKNMTEEGVIVEDDSYYNNLRETIQHVRLAETIDTTEFNINSTSVAKDSMDEEFGDMLPFGDPSWYQGYPSPYYTAKHRKMRSEMREFVETHIKPNCTAWDETGKIPRYVHKLFGCHGILAGMCTSNTFPSQYYSGKIIGGIEPDEFDPFMLLTIVDELSRCGSGGALAGIVGGLTIGLPPIIQSGSLELKEKVVPSCLKGDKIICLAITEPSAGSDVANLGTSAVKSADGKYYIVNGEKKWITNGLFADYFTTAVRTGGPGMGGISLLLLERTMPGIKVRPIKTSGTWSAGTTYITLEDVNVPVTNLIGVENRGFKSIMHNFNHERLCFVIQATRFSRICLEDTLTCAKLHQTPISNLTHLPSFKSACQKLAREIESTQAWLESLLYHLHRAPPSSSSLANSLSGPIALLKAHSSILLSHATRTASQFLTYHALTRGSTVGGRVERLSREVLGYSIPGGSEEIMLELGFKQRWNQYLKLSRL